MKPNAPSKPKLQPKNSESAPIDVDELILKEIAAAIAWWKGGDKQGDKQEWRSVVQHEKILQAWKLHWWRSLDKKGKDELRDCLIVDQPKKMRSEEGGVNVWWNKIKESEKAFLAWSKAGSPLP